MTEQEKELLTKDLCARLPYYNGFTVEWKGDTYNIIGVGFGRVTLIKPFMSVTAGSPLVEEVRPYLRPMSDISDDEVEEIRSRLNELNIGRVIDGHNFEKCCNILWFTRMFPNECVNHGMMSLVVDWLDAHNFDHRGLIDKGLAIKAPDGMYNISKTK